MKKLLNRYKSRVEESFCKNRTKNRIKDRFTGPSFGGGVSVFSNRSLSVVVALVTLFLQIISFMTTWQGAEVYFGGIFVLAPLFFALAIQSIVYFLSNSLRTRVSVVRVLSLVVAICCSTYFSYIGIYNTVSSPEQYLRDRYSEIYHNLNTVYDQQSSSIVTAFKDSINGVFSGVSNLSATNQSKLANLELCQAELDKVGSRLSGRLTAPNRSNFATYDAYVAAYNAYLASVSGNSSLESNSNIANILSRYGYADQQTFAADLNSSRAQQQTIESTVKSLASLVRPDAPGENFNIQLQSLRTAVYALLETSDLDTAQFETVTTVVSELVSLYDENEQSSSEILGDLKRLSSQLQLSNEPLMREYKAVKEETSSQENQNRALFDLKTQLESEIQEAVTWINAISPEQNRLSTQSEDLRIYDMYVLPVKNLTTPKTAPMAFLCLALAALVDLLTVLFAMILKRHHSALSSKKVTDIQHSGDEAISELILSSLLFSGEGEGSNSIDVLIGRLYAFIRRFQVSDAALEQGYSLSACMGEVKEYSVLVSILIQLNYAKIVPAEYYRILRAAPYNHPEIDDHPMPDCSGEDVVLLKSRFVLWCNQKFARYITAEEGE